VQWPLHLIGALPDLSFRGGTPERRALIRIHHRDAIGRATYLDEMKRRFNNRKNPLLFRATMPRLIHSDNLEYKELAKAA
jgi:hypothetical protein